jgi:predicted ribosome quality control (RQC) complex YloA/Tae2 family protein
MVGNYYTLLAMADSLTRVLPGHPVGPIFSQERDELVLGFEGLESVLVVSCRAGETTCFLHPHFTRARRNSVELLPDAKRRIIERVWLPARDRVLMLSCRDGSALALQLYPPHANVVLVDRDGTILDAFKRARELRGSPFALRSPTTAHGEEHPQPELARSGPAAAALRRRIPELGAPLAAELLHRCAMDPMAAIPSAEAGKRIEQQLAILLQELQTPQPRVFLDSDAVLFSLLPLHHRAPATVREFDDLHEALRFTVYRRRSASSFRERKNSLVHRLRQLADRTQRSLQALAEDQQGGSRAERYQRYGELLLTHLHEIPPDAAEVELPHPHGPQTIRLFPSLGVARTAQHYFDKARAARRAATESQARASSLAHRAALALELLGAVGACHDHHQLEDLMESRRRHVEHLGLASAASEQPEIPFRVFVVDGGFEVWAGKNSANNDLLTLRYARPRDLWFHARGSGGSHVILRTGSAPGEPGKRAKEQAAAIAAYYSKMRNASVVPVTVTERKHVRKPRGAPAGTVQVERESVVFAAPALPDPPSRTMQ